MLCFKGSAGLGGEGLLNGAEETNKQSNKQIMPETSGSVRGDHQPPDTHFLVYGKTYLTVVNLF